VANGYITNGENQIQNEPNELWENRGMGQNGYTEFVQVGVEAGINDIGDARGAAYADFNRDGFVDILVVNNNYVSDPGGGGPVLTPKRLLYVNQKNGTFREMGLSYHVRSEIPDGDTRTPRGDFTGNKWLQVRPVGTVSNRSGFGARVTVEAGDKSWIQDEGAGSYVSSNSHFLHFGLGTKTVADHVVVRFPSGTVVSKALVPLNQIITIHEDDVSPVRLLSFSAVSVAEGAKIQWTYVDDGDLSLFSVSRIRNGEETVLASAVRTQDGAGEYLDRNAPPGEAVEYALDAIYRDGNRERVGTVAFRLDPVSARTLGQNFPNPFAGSTAIPVAGAPGAALEVQIFDAAGRLVRTLDGVASESGLLQWDGTDGGGRRVPAGTYFYRVSGMSRTLKMIRRP